MRECEGGGREGGGVIVQTETWKVRKLYQPIMFAIPGQFGATYTGPGYIDVTVYPQVLRFLADMSTPC